MKRYIHIFIIILLLNGYSIHSQEISPLFEYWKYYSDDANALYKHISTVAFQQLEERKNHIRQLITKDNWELRRLEVQQKLAEIIGNFPDKTPLNPRITGKIEGDGFRVEKVIYESQPGFYVTAALFIPGELKGRAPAILYCSGHTYESFRSSVYQHMIINLVKKGYVVLAFDPIGQGERLQYLDEMGEKSIFRTPTHEHSYPGGQCFITGNSLARYMIWDGIRSIDYLISRPEVDPGRLGITGRSGGGTQSAYIAAFDPRIKVVAPECYITNFEYLFKSIGPQDAEQNFPGFLNKKLDLADLLEVRAPKPAMIISTTNDFFSIQGARDTFTEIKKVYEIFGVPENITMSEDEAGHETTLKNRNALYAFFKKHLDSPGNTEDLEVDIFNSDSLQITTTGQVIPEMRGETIFSLNKRESTTYLEKIIRRREDVNFNGANLRNWVIRYTGYKEAEIDPKYLFSGRETVNNYILEKFMVRGSGSYFLPIFILKPQRERLNKAVIIFNPEGKYTEMATDSLCFWLVDQGYHVFIPDIAGFGELGPGYIRGDAYMEHTSYNQWFAGILTGKSLTGVRMEDMLQVVEFVKREYRIDQENIYAIARGVLTSDLLHSTAVLNGFSRIALLEPLVSYQKLVNNFRYHPKYIQSAVPGSIQLYDLPDLAANFAPKKLLMVDVCDQNGEIIQDPFLDEDLQFIVKTYQELNLKEYFQLKESRDQSLEYIYNSWLE